MRPANSHPGVRGVIIETLTPHIGQHLAESSLRLHCEAIGARGESLSSQELERLLERFKKALRVFVGPIKADFLVQRILRRVEETGGL